MRRSGAQDWPPASALASTLHTFVAERAQKIIEHIIDAVRRDDRPMVREFARRWSAQLRKVAAQQHWLYPEVTSSIANYAIAMRQMADA
jgi:Tfp pilus assembly pilus retraction ATPase PilT